jgi:anaerobic selenocysteine-containing dehydrogenase
MYSLGDKSKNAHPAVIHIEGDPDHPVNRGTLCPKGAGLLDFVHSETRPSPAIPRPRREGLRQISWSEALDRIARLMKDDRDANFVAKNQDGTTVNRWLTTGLLAASATSNETATSPTRSCAAPGYWHSTTRRVSDTARRWQSCPDVWPWSDDEPWSTSRMRTSS